MTQTDTRSRILDVALACFLADGYEQTTIAQIRKRSGTSNGALFHHFPSKEAIAGHLDWDTAAGAELAARNRDLAAAFRQWMAPLVASGEIRPLPMPLTTAIVSGPAHAIAQRWLAGHLDRPLTSFLDELTIAACAGLSGTAPAADAGESRPGRPATARVTFDVLADDGTVVGHGQASAQLSP